ncbi:MAG: hypothetical protein IPO29_09045, partial [Anaerolineae bacterium]|nr:hypothetical protein [Anaerolineae bacterium]
VLAGFSTPLPAAADTITVTVSPGCGTIAACIGAASPGDTVFIPAGTYTESATLDKAVSLIGAGASSAIWVAAPNDRILTVTSPMTASTVIANLTFRGGNPGSGLAGGAMRLQADAQPALRRLNFASNTAAVGGAISSYAGLNLADSEFTLNTSTVLTGGAIAAAGSVYVTRTNFYTNFAAADGGALYVAFGAVSILGGTYRQNGANGSGGAMMIFGVDGALVEGVTLESIRPKTAVASPATACCACRTPYWPPILQHPVSVADAGAVSARSSRPPNSSATPPLDLRAGSMPNRP